MHWTPWSLLRLHNVLNKEPLILCSTHTLKESYLYLICIWYSLYYQYAWYCPDIARRHKWLIVAYTDFDILNFGIQLLTQTTWKYFLFTILPIMYSQRIGILNVLDLPYPYAIHMVFISYACIYVCNYLYTIFCISLQFISYLFKNLDVSCMYCQHTSILHPFSCFTTLNDT